VRSEKDIKDSWCVHMQPDFVALLQDGKPFEQADDDDIALLS